MEYLLKICELQDRNRAAEASVQPEAPVSDPQDEYVQAEEPQAQPYMGVELPQDSGYLASKEKIENSLIS